MKHRDHNIKPVIKAVIILWILATALVAALALAEEPKQVRHEQVEEIDPCDTDSPDYDENDCEETTDGQDYVQDGDMETNNNENDEDYEDR